MIDLPRSLEALDDKPQAEWTREDWRSFALFVVKQFRETVAVAERDMERSVRESRQYLAWINEVAGVNATLIEAQKFAIDLLAQRVQELLPKKRGRGRPRKATPASDSGLLAFFETARAAFMEALPDKRPTVNAVLTRQFEQYFVESGGGAYRAHSAEFKKKLKTMQNRISDARNPTKKNP